MILYTNTAQKLQREATKNAAKTKSLSKAANAKWKKTQNPRKPWKIGATKALRLRPGNKTNRQFFKELGRKPSHCSHPSSIQILRSFHQRFCLQQMFSEQRSAACLQSVFTCAYAIVLRLQIFSLYLADRWLWQIQKVFCWCCTK